MVGLVLWIGSGVEAGAGVGGPAGGGGGGGRRAAGRGAGPGRVRCEAEAHVASGESIAAGDVIIVRTPTFIRALRGRIGPHDATTREAEVWRWSLALAAREKGSGDVEARVRLVVCRGA